MKRSEIRRKFDEIVAFAEIEKFLDTPVKRYSSGMYVRLAFAVAAHLDTEILLVDEVLAVGDAGFQRKSIGKMGDVATGGRTVVFVSHNLGAIRSLRSHAILFENGRVKFSGQVDAALAAYEKLYRGLGGLISDARFQGDLTDQIKVERIVFRQDGAVVNVLNPTDEFEIEVRGLAIRPFSKLELTVAIFRDGIHVASCHDTPREAPLRAGAFTSTFYIPGDIFRPSMYTLGIGVTDLARSWTWGADVAAMDILEKGDGRSADRSRGIIGIPYKARRIQSDTRQDACVCPPV
jgi:lipopolysaccharide transport system ATP-binding protein